MVFSHPNHEIAVLGTIDRLRPHIVFLTDGGGEDRMAQSAKGLASYVGPEKLHFLRHSETSFYDALLDQNVALFASVAEQVRAVVTESDAEAIYCDAVEFYNPVHDMALPIVRAALNGREELPVYEVPLVHQRASDLGFEMQRVPHALDSEAIWSELTDAEFSRKVDTLRAGTYRALLDQMGEIIFAALPERGRREQLLPARKRLPKPAPDQFLRYDERGRELKSTGQVREAIVYGDHYAPMFACLTGRAAPRSDVVHL
jgi:hypothetical protein